MMAIDDDRDHTVTELDEHSLDTTDDRGLNRRTLWRAAASGFVLAGSGLLLPKWPDDEAVAREGAYGGKIGGRRGKDHRGQDRTRDRYRHRHDHDKDSDRNRPQGPLDNEGTLSIQFIFVNNNAVGTDPIDVTCFSYAWNTTVVGSEDRSVRPESGVGFTTAVRQASLYIDDNRHIVWARNPFWDFPTIEIDSGGAQSPTTVGPKGMAVGDTLSLHRANYKIDVTRNGDTETHKVFSVFYES
jgi:hypothetical protein